MDKSSLHNLIANARVEEALDELLKIAKNQGNKQMLSQVVQLLANHSKLKKDEMLGTISHDTAALSLNKIIRTTLDIILHLENVSSLTVNIPISTKSIEEPNSPVTNNNTGGNQNSDKQDNDNNGDNNGQIANSPTTKIPLWIGAATVLASIVITIAYPCSTNLFGLSKTLLAIGIAALTYYLSGFITIKIPQGVTAGGSLAVFVLIFFFNPTSYFQGKDCDTDQFNFTIRLIKPDLPNYPLFTGGKLKIWVVDRYESPVLNPDHVAEVKAVPSIQDGNMSDAKLEGVPYWKLEKDSVRLSKLAQTLKVVPDGSLDTLTVSVRNAEGTEPIPNALVEARGLPNVSTNAQGIAIIAIAKNLQKEYWEVSATSTGYKPWPESRFSPAVGTMDIRMMSNSPTKTKLKKK